MRVWQSGPRSARYLGPQLMLRLPVVLARDGALAPQLRPHPLREGVRLDRGHRKEEVRLVIFPNGLHISRAILKSPMELMMRKIAVLN